MDSSMRIDLAKMLGLTQHQPELQRVLVVQAVSQLCGVKTERMFKKEKSHMEIKHCYIAEIHPDSGWVVPYEIITCVKIYGNMYVVRGIPALASAYKHRNFDKVLGLMYARPDEDTTIGALTMMMAIAKGATAPLPVVNEVVSSNSKVIHDLIIDIVDDYVMRAKDHRTLVNKLIRAVS